MLTMPSQKQTEDEFSCSFQYTPQNLQVCKEILFRACRDRLKIVSTARFRGQCDGMRLLLVITLVVWLATSQAALFQNPGAPPDYTGVWNGEDADGPLTGIVKDDAMKFVHVDENGKLITHTGGSEGLQLVGWKALWCTHAHMSHVGPHPHGARLQPNFKLTMTCRDFPQLEVQRSW